MAANVAAMQSISALYRKFSTDTVSGYRNNKNPVTLFAAVCMDINRLCITYPERILTPLMNAIKLAQIHIRIEKFMTGNNLMDAAAANTRSAILSSFAPKSLVLPSFLAAIPSNISVKPAVI